MWTRVYTGPPYHITVEKGTAYISSDMKMKFEAESINSYLKLRSDFIHETSNEECLNMAVYSIKNTTGIGELCPTLLLFGKIPLPARNKPSFSQIQREVAIDEAMELIAREQAKRRIFFGLKHDGGRNREEKNLEYLPVGMRMRVYRTATKTWDGAAYTGI